jgi:hypothetical protein
VGLAIAGLLAGGLVLWRGAISGGSPTADGVGCSTMEQLSYHVHAHLSIFVEGAPSRVPANIGIRPDCISWLHTHDPDGIIHVEAPRPHTYTLGDFFGVWKQPLDFGHLLELAPSADQRIVATVNGQPYTGSPEAIPLESHAAIVVQLGPPFIDPPPFTFPPGS